MKRKHETSEKIDDLQNEENIDYIDNIPIYSRISSVPPIHKFKYASFVLKSIKDNQGLSKIIIKCTDHNQVQEIENWLLQEKTLTLCGGRPYFIPNERFELLAETETVFHLQQWQKINDKIIACLEKKNYLELFESISKQYSSPNRLFPVRKRLKVIEFYFDKLFPLISKKDISSFEDAYLTEKKELDSLHEKSVQKYKSQKEKKNPLSEISSQKTNAALTSTQDSSQDDIMLLTEIPKTPEQTTFSHIPFTNTTPRISQHLDKSFVPNEINSESRQKSNFEVNRLDTATIQSPPKLTKPHSKPLSDLATGPSSVSGFSWMKQKSRTDRIFEPRTLTGEKKEKLMQGLRSNIQNIIEEINFTHKEHNLTSDKIFSLTGSETLEELRSKKETYGAYMANLRSIRWQKNAALWEVPQARQAIMDLRVKLKLDLSAMPKQKNVNELTTSQLLEERDQLRAELEKLRSMKPNNSIIDVNSYGEESGQLDKTEIEKDKLSYFRNYK